MDPMIEEIQTRMLRIEQKYHSPDLPALVLRLLTAFAERGLLPDVPAADLPEIAQAARLHDLGKLSISEEILDAPAPLSPSAEVAIREHPEMGKAVLDALFSLGPGCPRVIVYAREICLHHHERWGGEGYPDHLRGDAIPRYVQVVSLADCYDALRTPRSYRPAMVHEAARNLILDFRCGSFDPRLLSCFADTIDACASGLCQGGIQHG